MRVFQQTVRLDLSNFRKGDSPITFNANYTFLTCENFLRHGEKFQILHNEKKKRKKKVKEKSKLKNEN